MAVTQNIYTGNGSTVLYSFTFPYLEQTDIKVSLNGVLTTQYTLANATTVQFNIAPANGTAIRIFRDTDDSDLTATFYPGSAIRAQDLNDNFIQNLYVTQEAVNTADAATATAAGAVSTANTALSNSTTAISTANTASSNASAAVSTANTASSNASSAVSTANAASATANTALSNSTAAVSTANTASSNATAAVGTANSAAADASQALSLVNNIVDYQIVLNVASIPGSPANGDRIEVIDSTGIQSFTPLSGIPSGFVGTSGLSVRLSYSSATSSWIWYDYSPSDPDARYLRNTTGSVSSSNIADGTIVNADINASAAIDLSKLATGALPAGITISSANLVDGTIVNEDVNASAAIAGTKVSPNFGSQNVTTTGTSTAASFIPTSSAVPTNGFYLPAANSVAISTNGTRRLIILSDGKVGLGAASVLQQGSGIDGGSAAGVLELYNGGTGNTTLENTGAFPILFKTNGSERLRITSAGLVGVGTSTPVDKLHVDGRIAVSTDSSTPTTGEAFFYKSASGAVMSGFGATIETGGAGSRQARVSVDSSGRVGIGTTSSRFALSIGSTATPATATPDTLDLGGTYSNTAGANPKLRVYWDGTTAFGLGVSTNQLDYIIPNTASHVFYRGSSESARIDSSGRLLVGTSTSVSTGGGANIQQIASPSNDRMLGVHFGGGSATGPYITFSKSRSSTYGSYSIVNNGDVLGGVIFAGDDGTDYATQGAYIEAYVDGTPGANDLPTRLVFSTTADGASFPTERMRITNGGLIDIGGLYSVGANAIRFDVQGSNFSRNTTSSATQIAFVNPNGTVGTITTSGSATAYNTSSDYRLKENVSAVTDGITRLQQLKPSRFNFIADPTKTVDGFIAHEVQTVVPEAISGEKDAVDADGKPIYQGIDQSKLVPLLTAALQEAITKIESLEARLTGAGI